jgi:polyisoprenoid-binding protein YceI
MSPRTRSPFPLRLAPWLLSIVALCASLTSAFAAAPAGPLPAPGEYDVDPAGSTVGFNVTELLVNNVSGKFATFSGRVVVGDSLSTSKIQATVDVGSIDTGIGMRNSHLHDAEFFDVARFPRMQFASTMIWGTPESFGIKGNLTIKGVTKEVVFSARILESGVIVAETKIDRTDFGVSGGGTIKNEVHLRLQIRLTRAAQGSGSGPH